MPLPPVTEGLQASEIDHLQDVLNQALDALRDELTRHGLPQLSSSASMRHPMDEANFQCPPRLYEARRLLIASIGQLKNLVQYPFEKIVEQSFTVYDAACLDILVKTGLVDRLSAPSIINIGMDVHDMQRQLGMDALKLTAVLRYLASQGWLCEVKEGTFALTRAALELQEGHNGRKWAMTPGKPQISQALMAHMTHPEWSHSRKADETAFQIAYDTSLTLFAWMNEHPEERVTWSQSIQAIGDAYRSSTIEDFPWQRFDSWKLVDCAGGQGNLSIYLSEVLSHSTFIVQDLPEVTLDAQANIERNAYTAFKAGRILAESVDLFDVQPRRGDEHVYILRHILHNWSDDSCITILKNIASVASPTSKVLILEAVSSPNIVSERAPGDVHPVTLDNLKGQNTYQRLTPPAHIPSNFGMSSKMPLALGVHMMGVLNAHERTYLEWTKVVTEAGLRIVKVYHHRGMISTIECETAV